MCAGFNRAQKNTSSMFGIIINTRNQAQLGGPEKSQCFNHSRHFSGVVGVSSGTCKSKMSLGGDDRTKRKIYSSMERSSDSISSTKGFTINKARTPVNIDGPPLQVIASRVVVGTCGGDADICLWASASGDSDAGLQACGLLDMLPGADSPFHVPKVSRILDASAVLMISMEASQETPV